MAHDLFDAMVGADRSAIITMVSPKGQQKRVHRSQYGKLVKQGWRLVQPAATRPMQVPGYSQPGYPQQPMLQAQPYGQPGATILPGQPGYPYLPGQPGYGSPAPTNYGAQGPVNYGPQGYQGPPSYSAPDQGAGPYPDEGGGDDQGLDQDQDGDASLGLAAAVGEATALGTEQYATVGGGVDITRWLVDPWDAATADAAHKLMAVASGLTQASMANRFTAQRMIAALKSQSAKGNPLAQRAMIKFGSITQMVTSGQPVPSVVMAQRNGQLVLAVALPSLTIMLTVEVPLWFTRGVSVTVRLLPLPPNEMPFVGSNVAAEDAAHTLRLPAGVSLSPMTNGIGPELELVAIVWLAMDEIVGGELTVTVKV